MSDGVGVSRITARKAIALLVEQGLIRRVRGAGSFITPRVEDPLSRLTGFTKKMEQRGFRPDSVWLEREVRTANRDETGAPRIVAGCGASRACGACAARTAS